MNTRLTMINENLQGTPLIALPQGYYFRFFQTAETRIWTNILTKAGEFPTEDAAAERFINEFSFEQMALKDRLLFITNEDGTPIGTAMGWYNLEFKDGNYGRLHWVSIIPEFQGKGLARPLVTKALQIMEEKHQKAYLTTRPRSFKGIKLYLDYGFKPLLTTPDCLAGWKLVENLLKVQLIP